MTALLELPPLVVEDGGDEPYHYTCCRQAVARCGVRLDAAAVDDDYDTGLDCDPCLDVIERDRPCGAPLCRLRRWLRERRWSW